MIARVKVIASRALTPSSHAIRLEKPPGFHFRPVQFCGLEFDTAEGAEEYPMSLACSPTKSYLEFGTRISDSAWKRAFAALKPGDEVEIDGPYGHFVLDETRDAVFIAGGIGITPLKGMADYLADTASPCEARLVFCNKAEDEIIYREELDGLERECARFRIFHTLTREPRDSAWRGRRGRIDIPLLKEASAGLHMPVWYVCGKPELIKTTLAMLSTMGIPNDRIRYELFSGYD